MIYGIGIDLVEVERVAALLERQGQRAVERLYAPAEIAYCAGMARPMPHYAGRLAAKEAFVKALGTGFREGAQWNEVEVVLDDLGRPSLCLHGATRALLAERCGAGIRLHVSLSHTESHATAVVMIEIP